MMVDYVLVLAVLLSDELVHGGGNGYFERIFQHLLDIRK